MDRKVLDTKEAAEYLRCGETRMLELIRSGRVRAAKVGKTYVIKSEWLDDFLEAEAGRQASTQRVKQGKRKLPDLDRYDRVKEEAPPGPTRAGSRIA